jgi:integrase
MTVPSTRMKGGEKNGDHVAYLSPRALSILREMLTLGGTYVFPNPEDLTKPLSNMAMLALLHRMDVDAETTVHGRCRARFSTWGNEGGVARPDVIEACLAHQEANLARASYNRATFAKERAALLTAWQDFLDGKEGTTNVIEFPQQKSAARRPNAV